MSSLGADLWPFFMSCGDAASRKNFAPSADKNLAASSGSLDRLLKHHFAVF